MKTIIIIALIVGIAIPGFGGEKKMVLPSVPVKSGMDVVEAIEKRATSRAYDGRRVSMEAIAAILWAGNGIILDKGYKTIHGFDAISGATSENRYTIPWGWGDPYLKIYLLLENGAWEYLPKGHRLRYITDRNLMAESGSDGAEASGVIMIAADLNQMPSYNQDVKNVAFLSAGSAAQNMYVVGAAYHVQMLTQVSFRNDRIIKGLELADNIEPLAILTFGYAN